MKTIKPPMLGHSQTEPSHLCDDAGPFVTVGPRPDPPARSAHRVESSSGRQTIKQRLRDRGIEDPQAYCRDPESPVEQLYRMVRVRRYRCDDLADDVARNPAMPMDRLLNLTRFAPLGVSENPVFRLHMATVPGFLNSLDRHVRQNLAAGHGVDPRLLRELAGSRSHSKSVRRAAAMNPTAPADMLEDFMRHAWQVRAALAGNPALPAHLIARLAEDPRREVRQNIVRRERVPPEVLHKMALNDTDETVRMGLVRHTLTPEDAIAHLDRVGSPVIRDAIRRRSEMPWIKKFWSAFHPDVVKTLLKETP